MRPLIIACSCLILLVATVGFMAGSPGALASGAPESPLVSPIIAVTSATDLAVEPDGQRVAVLLPGAAMRVIETRGNWSHVSLDGWIRADGASATPVPNAAPASQAGSIGGSVFITGERGRTSVGSGVAVRLLTDPQSSAGEVAAIRSECDQSRAALKQQADALKDKGERAMKTIENPSQAFEAFDEAKKARLAKLRESKDLDSQCNARAESALDSHTVARALSSAEGRYQLQGVAPGRYLVHALFEAEGIRHEWDVEVTLAPGQQLSFDLTNANQTRSETVPIYR